MHCASAIFKCAEDEPTRQLVATFKGIEPLVQLLQKESNKVCHVTSCNLQHKLLPIFTKGYILYVNL